VVVIALQVVLLAQEVVVIVQTMQVGKLVQRRRKVKMVVRHRMGHTLPVVAVVVPVVLEVPRKIILTQVAEVLVVLVWITHLQALV
jgi:hypothetical protein